MIYQSLYFGFWMLRNFCIQFHLPFLFVPRELSRLTVPHKKKIRINPSLGTKMPLALGETLSCLPLMVLLLCVLFGRSAVAIQKHDCHFMNVIDHRDREIIANLYSFCADIYLSCLLLQIISWPKEVIRKLFGLDPARNFRTPPFFFYHNLSCLIFVVVVCVCVCR